MTLASRAPSRSRRPAPFLAAVLLPIAAACAQETSWVASRTSVELHAIDPAGRVLRVIDLSANAPALRSVHLAPDGRLWVVNFIQPFFTIVDPASGGLTNVTNALGSPYEIAFDAQGHAWVSGGTGVVHYDQNGVQRSTHPLAAAQPLGITIDAIGNKWIAHHTAAPGSISRIDPSGVVSNHVPPRGGIQPTRLLADYRGAGPSHIWVVGDNAVGDVYHLDFTGTLLQVVSTGSQLGSIVQDGPGHIWVGSFGNGNLFEIDPAGGAILNTFTVAPSIQGLAIDGFRNLWATARLTAPAASELRRIDKSTGAVQVAAVVGVGAQSALATLFHQANVVDPGGDLDGDGLFNQFETYYGCSPRDPCSYGNYSVAIRGSSRIGSAARLDFGVAGLTPTLAYFHAFATGTVAPGSGLTLPQVGCEALLALPPLASGFVNGTSSVALPIPNSPSYAGLVVFLQALALEPFGALRFTNVSALRVWM